MTAAIDLMNYASLEYGLVASLNLLLLLTHYRYHSGLLNFLLLLINGIIQLIRQPALNASL